MKFELGKVVITQGVHNACEENLVVLFEVQEAFARYQTCDWGMLDKHDWKMNDNAIKYDNDRILGRYSTMDGVIYIITEWDRSVTTILFASEY